VYVTLLKEKEDIQYMRLIDSASNRNEYQEDFLGVNAAGA
jgi:hypothetical protein